MKSEPAKMHRHGMGNPLDSIIGDGDTSRYRLAIRLTTLKERGEVIFVETSQTAWWNAHAAVVGRRRRRDSMRSSVILACSMYVFAAVRSPAAWSAAFDNEKVTENTQTRAPVTMMAMLTMIAPNNTPFSEISGQERQFPPISPTTRPKTKDVAHAPGKPGHIVDHTLRLGDFR
jgi:hypothetical protein